MNPMNEMKRIVWLLLSRASDSVINMHALYKRVYIHTVINPLKKEFSLNFIQKFSSYLTGNTLRLRYKAQPINAV
jgi:hypothetical protein